MTTSILVLVNLGCSTDSSTANGPGPTAADAATARPAVRRWYRDGDGDGFGDAQISRLGRIRPPGYVADSTDCDDAHDLAYPGAPVGPTDGLDSDCSGSAEHSSVRDLSLWRYEPHSDYAWAGITMETGSDFDGDGQTDLALGGGSVTLGGVSYRPTVTLFEGPLGAGPTALDETSATAILHGGTAFDLARVSGVGDLDGDGADDLVIGSPVLDRHGVTRIVRGPFAGEIDLTVDEQAFYGTDDLALMGTACAGPGDVDGDGLPDVIFSEPGYNGTLGDVGSVYLMRGPAEQSSADDADLILRGDGTYEHIGWGVDELGDINADGLADYAVSSWGNPDGFSTYLVTEYATGVMHPRDVGAKVSAGRDHANRIGDINADGYDDVAFYNDGPHSVAVVVVEGPIEADDELHLEAAGDVRFETSVGGPWSSIMGATSVGDWNGDGNGAIAIADGDFATYKARTSLDCASSPGCAQGAIYIMAKPIASGVHDLAVEADRIEGDHPRGYLGGHDGMQTFSGGSDLNGDGAPDLVFAAAEADTDAVGTNGVTYVLFGDWAR